MFAARGRAAKQLRVAVADRSTGETDRRTDCQPFYDVYRILCRRRNDSDALKCRSSSYNVYVAYMEVVKTGSVVL